MERRWPFQCLLLCGVGSPLPGGAGSGGRRNGSKGRLMVATRLDRALGVFGARRGYMGGRMVPVVSVQYKLVNRATENKISNTAARRRGAPRYGVFLLLFEGCYCNLHIP